MTVSESYPELLQVFGGYLHQDFDVEYDSPDEALRGAAAEWGPDISSAIREIDDLLAQGLPHAELETIIERLTAGYAPELDGWDARQWLEHARAILRGDAA